MSSTRSETFVRSSRASRSLSLPERHHLPVLPGQGAGVDEEEHGDGRLLDLQRREGGDFEAPAGATVCRADSSAAERVSPMVTSPGPEIHTMSPAPTSSTSTRSRPRITQRWVERAGSTPVTSQAVRA